VSARACTGPCPETPQQIVNIAQWDCIEQRQAAPAGFQPQSDRGRQAQTAGNHAQPAFYRSSP